MWGKDMISSESKTRIYTLLFFAIIIGLFFYVSYLEKKLERDKELLYQVHYDIDNNFKRCNTIFYDILEIWDDNYLEHDWDTYLLIDEYLNIRSVKSYIDVDLKNDQQYIDHKIQESVKEIKYKNKPIYETFKKMSASQKEYCLSVISFRLKGRDNYSENVNDFENYYQEISSDILDIIDYLSY